MDKTINELVNEMAEAVSIIRNTKEEIIRILEVKYPHCWATTTFTGELHIDRVCIEYLAELLGCEIKLSVHTDEYFKHSFTYNGLKIYALQKVGGAHV